MKQRIKQLAEQARQIGEYGNYGQIQLSPAQFEQKFAELIVRECADTVTDRCEMHGEYDEKRAEYYAKRIKEHFGVEE